MSAGTFDRIDVIDGREYRVFVLPDVPPPTRRNQGVRFNVNGHGDIGWSGPPVKRTTRAHSRRVPCPTCHAAIGENCTGSRGQRRIAQHAARHDAAIAAGAPVTSMRSGPP